MNNMKYSLTKDGQIVTVNGYTGVLVNQDEIDRFSSTSSIPIRDYPINQDPNPIIIPKPCDTQHRTTQDVSVRFLQPPPIAPPGDIIIKEESAYVPPPAPPVVIRLPSPKLPRREAQAIRETPPDMPGQIPQRIITVPGPRAAPPPRKVVVIKPPPIPEPQPIEIDRWVAPQVPDRVVKFIPASTVTAYAPVRNEILECEAPRITVEKIYKDLGVSIMSARDYNSRYGNTTRPAHQLPDIARDVRPPGNHILACQVPANYYTPRLVGDLFALSKIDLDREGLGEYKHMLGRLPTGGYTGTSSSVTSGVAGSGLYGVGVGIGTIAGSGAGAGSGYSSYSTSYEYRTDKF